jgi:DNA-directed RNA polymerase specialized sigma24 family protein
MSASDNGVPDFAQFVTARYPALVRYGTLLTGDCAQGEDLTQDSLVRTHRTWRHLHPDGDPEAYTLQVMARAAWRSGRRRWRRPSSSGRPATGTVVLDALWVMPAGPRVVLVLRHWAGLSESEVATWLGCSIGTVRIHESRAAGALPRAAAPVKSHASMEPAGGPMTLGRA